jgi:hypothetical protein
MGLVLDDRGHKPGREQVSEQRLAGAGMGAQRPQGVGGTVGIGQSVEHGYGL